MRIKPERTASRIAATLTCMALLGACDVTNPGPVQDEFIALPASQQGLINGAIKDISDAMGDNAYTTALLAREIFPGGQTGAWGHGVTLQGGHVLPGTGPNFTTLHEARFIAETAIKRFTAAGAPDAMMFQAHIWAAFAYRWLGEWWCEAVLPSTDPDDREPGAYETTNTGYFQRAIDNFSDALGYAATDEERYAALGGRAAAYVWMGQWASAYADASAVPDNFVFWAQMDELEEVIFNDLYEAQNGQFRSYTIEFTWFNDHYTDTGDPRTPWETDPDYATTTASLQGFGGAPPFKRQLKYTSRDSDFRLVSGWEMRLIEAEAILEGAGSGDRADALDLINQVHTRNISDLDSQPLPPVTAADATETWTALKRERYIELWLEGRRMGDERRWAANNTPGDLDTPDWEDPTNPGYTTLFTDNPRSYCFDIPEAERDRNPNVPATGG